MEFEKAGTLPFIVNLIYAKTIELTHAVFVLLILSLWPDFSLARKTLSLITINLFFCIRRMILICCISDRKYYLN